MPLMEIQLLLPEAKVDAWSDAVLAAGAASVSVTDEDGGTAEELASYGEPGLTPRQIGWKNNRVCVLVDDAADIEAIFDAASHALGFPSPPILSRRPVQDCDWVRETQSQFGPIAIGRIWIVPSWHEPPDPHACNVRIDPGVAFGTGTHPTTRLCISWIDEHLEPGCTVLDYGCGSGILSICSALLGAAEVVGVDIDEQALLAARANAQRNGVRALYTTPVGLASAATGDFDLVVANILANPIMLLATTLLRRLRPGGSMLLSGILERQAQAVIDVYRGLEPRLELRISAREEGWVALAGSRGS